MAYHVPCIELPSICNLLYCVLCEHVGSNDICQPWEHLRTRIASDEFYVPSSSIIMYKDRGSRQNMSNVGQP
jgi:hypothetical protein